MKRFVEGVDRTQVSLLPECVDDYVAEDNPPLTTDGNGSGPVLHS